MNRRQLLVQSASVLGLAGCAPMIQSAGLPDALFAGPRLEETAFYSFDGARLGLQRWLPAGEPWAVVIGLHGMNDDGKSFAIPAPRRQMQGIAT